MVFSANIYYTYGTYVHKLNWAMKTTAVPNKLCISKGKNMPMTLLSVQIVAGYILYGFSWKIYILKTLISSNNLQIYVSQTEDPI